MLLNYVHCASLLQLMVMVKQMVLGRLVYMDNFELVVSEQLGGNGEVFIGASCGDDGA